jgi:hypothetical protein
MYVVQAWELKYLVLMSPIQEVTRVIEREMKRSPWRYPARDGEFAKVIYSDMNIWEI